jgi:DNA repair protein RecO (recombination protein O)
MKRMAERSRRNAKNRKMGHPVGMTPRGKPMYINTTGLILRETTYKETSKILTILTASEGKITVMAKGVRRRGSKMAGGVQLLAFSDLTLSENRGRYILTEAQSIELFAGLRTDVERLALGAYFAEIMEAVSDEDMQNPGILSLGLNALFALSEGKKDPMLIKAAFELRMMCLAGFTPAVLCCAVCGTDMPDRPVLNLTGGVVLCRKCAAPEPGGRAELCPGSLAAIRHITTCEPKRIFSFSLGADSIRRLAFAAENYLLAQLDRGFKTLDFYKSIKYFDI